MRELGAIERIATPFVEEFRERYVDKCRPVILEGAVRDWPAMQRWNGDGLVEHYGEHRVWVGTTLRTIRELVETIQTGGDARTDFTILQAPWLLRDLGVLPYLDPRKVTFINVWVGG